MIKRLLIGATLFALIALGVKADAANPAKIVGLVGACDTTVAGCIPIPLNPSFLCDGTGAILDCPQYASPNFADTTGSQFYGLTNRVNPPRCVKSINGGTGWGLCDAGTASPFTGALDNLGANFAVASDGSLIAAGDQGTDNCIIRRSTNGGVSWTTVFTDSTTVNVSCGLGFGAPTPNTLRCASANPYCVMISFISGSFDLLAYWSTNNGASWSTGTPFNIVSADAQIGVAVASNGSSGSLTRYAGNYNTAGRVFAKTSGADWTTDGLIPTPPGEADGNAFRCVSGAMIFSGQSVLCGPGSALTTTYHFYTHGAGSTANAANVIPQNGLTNAQAPNFMAVGYSGTAAYIVGRNAATTQVVIWVTQDTFSTMFQVGTLTPTTALIGGCCSGDIFSYRGKIYFTSGASGSNAFFGVVQ